MFLISIVAVGREPSGSLLPDGLRRPTKEGIYLGTVSKLSIQQANRDRFAVSHCFALLRLA